MMKTTRISLAALVVLTILLSACTGPEDIPNELIGSWKYTNYQTGDWEKLTFKEDLTYVLIHYDGTYYTTTTYSGNYSYTETSFTLKQRYSYDIAFYYAISGNNLIIADGKTYIRQ